MSYSVYEGQGDPLAVHFGLGPATRCSCALRNVPREEVGGNGARPSGHERPTSPRRGDGMQWTLCPQCGQPAEIVDRDIWPSTDGPVAHVHVRCVSKHRFVMPAASLTASQALSTAQRYRSTCR